MNDKPTWLDGLKGCSLCWGCLPEGETCKACGTTNEPNEPHKLNREQRQARTKLAEQIHKAVGEIPDPLRRF